MSLSLLIDESNSLRFEYQLEDLPCSHICTHKLHLLVLQDQKCDFTKANMNREAELFHVWLEWVQQTNKAKTHMNESLFHSLFSLNKTRV